MTAPLPDRFWRKVDVHVDGCWLWTAATSHDGYPMFAVASKIEYAHRVAYEALVGPIPVGLELDHLCRVPACVRPDHLEPVTHRENVLRGVGIVAAFAARTHCPHGHAYDEANTYISRSGGRFCRTCDRLKKRALSAAKRSLIPPEPEPESQASA